MDQNHIKLDSHVLEEVESFVCGGSKIEQNAKVDEKVYQIWRRNVFKNHSLCNTNTLGCPTLWSRDVGSLQSKMGLLKGVYMRCVRVSLVSHCETRGGMRDF